jgi:hypothetical protein
MLLLILLPEVCSLHLPASAIARILSNLAASFKGDWSPSAVYLSRFQQVERPFNTVPIPVEASIMASRSVDLLLALCLSSLVIHYAAAEVFNIGG